MLYLQHRTLIVYLGNEIGRFIKSDVHQFDFWEARVTINVLDDATKPWLRLVFNMQFREKFYSLFKMIEN